MKLPAVVAGQFYPGDRKKLQTVLEGFSKQEAVQRFDPDPAALLLPHAGYTYSGSIAALGYRSMSNSVKTVVIVGPSHYMSFKGASIFAGDSVETPLGDLIVDKKACQALMDLDDHVSEVPPLFAREHSVEVHFPLVYHYLPGAKVVPIVMGQGMEESVKPLTKALLALWKREPFLLVVSSDLSHYPAYDIAKKADEEFLEALLTGDSEKVKGVDERIMDCRYPEYYCTHCGKEPVSTLLGFAKGIGLNETRLLKYLNSGDVTGDRSRVVGYAAAAFFKNDPSLKAGV